MSERSKIERMLRRVLLLLTFVPTALAFPPPVPASVPAIDLPPCSPAVDGDLLETYRTFVEVAGGAYEAFGDVDCLGPLILDQDVRYFEKHFKPVPDDPNFPKEVRILPVVTDTITGFAQLGPSRTEPFTFEVWLNYQHIFDSAEFPQEQVDGMSAEEYLYANDLRVSTGVGIIKGPAASVVIEYCILGLGWDENRVILLIPSHVITDSKAIDRLQDVRDDLRQWYTNTKFIEAPPCGKMTPQVEKCVEKAKRWRERQLAYAARDKQGCMDNVVLAVALELAACLAAARWTGAWTMVALACAVIVLATLAAGFAGCERSYNITVMNIDSEYQAMVDDCCEEGPPPPPPPALPPAPAPANPPSPPAPWDPPSGDPNTP